MVWRDWARVGRMQNPAGYAYRVAQSANRRHRRWRRGVEFPSEHFDPAWEDVTGDIFLSLGALKRLQRTCVVMVHAHGWSYREVAAIVGISVAAVTNHVHRGMQRLRSETRGGHMRPSVEERLARAGRTLDEATDARVASDVRSGQPKPWRRRLTAVAAAVALLLVGAAVALVRAGSDQHLPAQRPVPTTATVGKAQPVTFSVSLPDGFEEPPPEPQVVPTERRSLTSPSDSLAGGGAAAQDTAPVEIGTAAVSVVTLRHREVDSRALDTVPRTWTTVGGRAAWATTARQRFAAAVVDDGGQDDHVMASGLVRDDHDGVASGSESAGPGESPPLPRGAMEG